MHETYGAHLVDMEAATVARLAAGRGIPFYCTKGVSDDANAALPELNRFISAGGQMRMTEFVAYVLLRPMLWPGLIKLGRNSAHATTALADAIYGWIDEREYILRGVSKENNE